MRLTEVAIGDVISHYRIVEFIGGGGMGIVYKAEDLKLGRSVALKFLPPELTSDHDARQRFLLEARAASRLDHPNICTVHEVGESEDGQIWIAMAYYDGGTLKQRLARGPLPIPHAIRIAKEIAEGLGAAHEAGIIHRDIKPANIIVNSHGNAKIVDFGIAKLTGQTITHPTVAIGTAAYMSPEQFRGQPVTPASDLWALGVVFFEMLTGRYPMTGEHDQAVLYSILHHTPPAVSSLRTNVPPELDAIVAKLLRKDPAERYASAAALIDDLGRVQHDSRALEVTQRRFQVRRLVGKAPRGLLPSILVLAAILAVVVGTVLVVDRISDGKTLAGPRLADFPARKQLAVLPFTDLGGRDDTRRLAAGLADSVAAGIANTSDIQVIFPGNSTEWKPDMAVAEVGRRWGANLVLRGSMLVDDQRIRVTYAIVDPKSGRQLAGDTVDGARAELLDFHDAIVEAAITSLGGSIERAIRPPARRIAGADAQEHYFQALASLQRYEDPESVGDAIRLLTELEGSAGRSALVSAALGRAYLYRYDFSHDAGDAGLAKRYCDDALSLDAALPEALVTKGDLAMRLSRFDEATAAFRRALEINPGSADATLGLAKALDRSGNKVEAENTFKTAIAMRPDYWAGYNGLGVFYLFSGRLEEAVGLFRRVTELSPDNVRGLSNLGAALVGLERYDEAATAFERSIQVRPNGDAYSNLGTSYYMSGRFDDAARAYEKATALEPKDSVHWYNLGDARRATGQASGASDAYAKAIQAAGEDLKVKPDHAPTISRIALSLAKRGDVKQAEKELARVRKLRPDTQETLFASAMINNIAGNRERALEDLRAAVDKGYPKSWIVRDPEFANLREDPWFAQLRQ